MKNTKFGSYVKRALEQTGFEHQCLALAEETSELIVEINHARRNRGSREKVLEELADVQMMINEFKILFDIEPDEFEEMYQQKLIKFYKQVDDNA